MPPSRDRQLANLVLLLALAASLTGLFNGYALDDVAIVLGNDHVHHLLAPWQYFAEPYWPAKNGAGLYRPLTIIGYALQWAIGGGAPVVFHAANILLYGASALALLWFARAFLSPSSAFAAAALFAVHPVHVEAVANVVGQPEIVVALLVLIAVGWYLRAREQGKLGGREIGGLLLLYLLALCFKEHALVLPGLLVAAELLLVSGGEPPRQRLRAQLPLLIAMVAVFAAFWTVRTIVLQGLAPHDLHPAFRDGRFQTRLFTTLGVVPVWARLLLFPIHLSADYNPQYVPVLTGFGWRAAFGLLLASAVATLAFRWRRLHPPVAFGLAWFAIAIFPVSNLLVPTGILLAERTLFLPSVGICLALGYGVEKGLEQITVPARRRAVLVGFGALLSVGVFRSAFRQPVWQDNDTLFPQMVRDAPNSYKALGAHAGLLFSRGVNEAAEREYLKALDLYPFNPDMFSDLGDFYIRNHRYEDALRIYRRALALDPRHWGATSRSIYALIQLGRLEEARQLAQTAADRGDEGAPEKLAYVDSLIARQSRSAVGAGGRRSLP